MGEETQRPVEEITGKTVEAATKTESSIPEKPKNEQLRWAMISGGLMTLAFSFLLALYAPLELFFTNIDEFRFGFSALCPELLQLFGLLLMAGMAAFAFCYVLYDRLFDVVLMAGLIVYVCTYVQGMFLVGNLPPVDGSPIQWGSYRAEMLQSLILWAVVFVAVVLMVRFLGMKRMYKVASGLSAFFTAILLVTLVTVCLTNDGLAPKPEAVVTDDEMLTMSENQNLVVFIIDAADASTFTELMETDDPEFRDILEDFTYYPNTVAAYPFTRQSIPFILSGQWDENREPFFEYTNRAYETSPLLNRLKEEEYRIGIYEEEVDYSGEGIYDFENVHQSRFVFSSTKKLLKAEMKLVWFKYAPFPLKKYVRVDMQEFNKLLLLEDGAEAFSPNNGEFYGALCESDVERVSARCFRFIHIEGAHVPFRYDQNVNVIPEEEGSYPLNMECSMTILKTYLQKLKDAGVYDNTAIVVMGDHGYGYNREIPIVGRMNPVLAVKGIGESHEMYTSQAPISFEDLQTAYDRLLDGVTGEDVFDAREGDDRPRRCLLFFYQEENHMMEYVQTGHASDIETMIPTGEVFDAPQNGHGGGKPGPKMERVP